MSDEGWTAAMIELNASLEEAKENGITKEEALQEVENIYGKDE